MCEAALIDVSVDVALDVAAHDCGTLCVHSVSVAQQSFALANVLQRVLLAVRGSVYAVGKGK